MTHKLVAGVLASETKKDIILPSGSNLGKLMSLFPCPLKPLEKIDLHEKFKKTKKTCNNKLEV